MRSRNHHLMSEDSGENDVSQGGRRRRRGWLLCAAPAAMMLLALTASCSRGPTDPITPREVGGTDYEPAGYVWKWDPAANGAPAVLYEVEMRGAHEDWRQACKTQATEARIDRTDNHQVRVRGIDGRGRSGTWSPPSGWTKGQEDS